MQTNLEYPKHVLTLCAYNCLIIIFLVFIATNQYEVPQIQNFASDVLRLLFLLLLFRVMWQTSVKYMCKHI